MNILFMTLVNIRGFEEQLNIYADLCRRLIACGHSVDIVCPDEESIAGESNISFYGNNRIIKVSTGHIQKTNIIKKGFLTLTVGYKFKSVIKKECRDKSYDMIVYSTPPITLVPAIKYIKKRDNAKSYLLLKDIFPQNAVDIGIMSTVGIKSVIFRYFRSKEKQLYKISDYIGCMSKANVDYLLENNKYIPADKVHINPNSIEVLPLEERAEIKKEIRAEYSIPENAKALIYGGNLGKPQGVEFITECIAKMSGIEDSFLCICGKGTETEKLKMYLENNKPDNVMFIEGLPRAEYEKFVKAFDIGLIFLDSRFTIPNFPSRLLSYMQAGMPVIACTDKNTDLGKTIESGNFGKWCESKNAGDFAECVKELNKADIKKLGENAYNYLKNNFDVAKSAELIISSYENSGDRNENS